MHLETIQHLRSLAGRHDDLVPIAKPLLLDLLDSYEEGATIKREYMDLAGALNAHDHAEAVVKLRDLQQWCAMALQAIDPACGVTESLATLRGITLGFSSQSAGTPARWIPVAESMPETLVPVIVYGILEGEYEHDRHEAFRRHIGARDPWRSPRMENDENLRLREVTHWMEMPPPPVNTVNPVNPVPTPETFEAHGHTWTRHTPGDPCPVSNPDALVHVLTLAFGGPSQGAPSRAGLCGWHVIQHHNYAWGEIIGWRYADPQPSTPDK